jgi:hypothetical protein
MARVRAGLSKPPPQQHYAPQPQRPPQQQETGPIAGLRSALGNQRQAPPHYQPPQWYF